MPKTLFTVILFAAILAVGSSCNPAATTETDLHRVEIEERYGCIDSNGNLVVPPLFRSLGRFSEGLAAAQPADSPLFGYIRTDGQWAIPPAFVTADSFSEGLAAVRSDRGNGYIDRTGKIVIPLDYDRAGPFRNGRALIVANGAAVYIGPAGQTLALLPHIPWIDTAADRIPFLDGDRRLGFMDPQGNIVIEARYSPYKTYVFQESSLFSEPVMAVHFNGKWGFIDRNGQVVLDFQFNWAEPFSEGLAVVSRDGLFGYVDAEGRLAIPPRYEVAVRFSEGLAAVKVNGKWGFIDKTGTMVIPPQFFGLPFGSPIRFSEGLAAVRMSPNGAPGYIGRDGRTVIEPGPFRTADDFSGALAEVRPVDPAIKRALINRDGAIVWQSHLYHRYWSLITRSESPATAFYLDDTNIYWDPDTAGPERIVTFWIKAVYENQAENGAAGQTWRAEARVTTRPGAPDIPAANSVARQLDRKVWDAGGVLLEADGTPGEWQPIPAGSILDKALNRALRNGPRPSGMPPR